MPTNISWATETWSPVIGCTKIGAGCQNCYAIGWAHRHANNPRMKDSVTFINPYEDLVEPNGKNWTGEVSCIDARLEIPLHWKKPRRIFLPSMGDIFHEDVPDEFLDKIFAVMVLCPQHQFMVLTKRPDRMREFICRSDARVMIHAVLWEMFGPDTYGIAWPLPNVALGVSVSNQPEADASIPELLQTPAAMRFISAEPLLGGLDLLQYLKPVFRNCDLPCANKDDELERQGALSTIAKAAHEYMGSSQKFLDLVIAGGETGPGARPSHPQWFRDLRYQCAEAGVPFHFKQWGEWEYIIDAEDMQDHMRHDGDSDDLRDNANQCQIVGVSGNRIMPERSFDWWESAKFADADVVMRRVGKKAAGRLLDGIEHNGMMDHTKKWDEQ